MERPLFVILGNSRIRLSDIKTYGISWYDNAREFKEEEPSDSTYNDIMNYVRKEYNIASYVGYANIDNYVPEFYKYTKYLYIETYQGDYYDYYQVLSSFNIYKKLKELDSYLT